ncbi:hypothetical protein M5K25_027704 [Dendrobium thyrsiflorum]|uniref:Uncharacterized protein n=1 Tax=Dendrobium thyrsiflorum TaxID=117978 RepID=A0ABD0TUM8_DENTH
MENQGGTGKESRKSSKNVSAIKSSRETTAQGMGKANRPARENSQPPKANLGTAAQNTCSQKNNSKSTGKQGTEEPNSRPQAGMFQPSRAHGKQQHKVWGKPTGLLGKTANPPKQISVQQPRTHAPRKTTAKARESREPRSQTAGPKQGSGVLHHLRAHQLIGRKHALDRSSELPHHQESHLLPHATHRLGNSTYQDRPIGELRIQQTDFNPNPTANGLRLQLLHRHVAIVSSQRIGLRLLGSSGSRRRRGFLLLPTELLRLHSILLGLLLARALRFRRLRRTLSGRFILYLCGIFHCRRGILGYRCHLGWFS